MDFALTEQQEMIREVARDFLAAEYPEKVMKSMAADETGFSPELWRKMAATNLTGLGIPEEYGGAGDFLDLTLVLEEMGRACFTGPFFSTVVLGAGLIMAAGNSDQKKELLTAIAGGRALVTLAWLEDRPTGRPEDIRMMAVARGQGAVLHGRKIFVPDAAAADYLICAAQTGERAGLSLLLLPARTSGISCRRLPTISGEKLYEVNFRDVLVGKEHLLGNQGEGSRYLEKVLPRAAIGRCAEMVGMASRVLQITLDYARERTAFGHPIGAFQAIQHRCADMLVDVDGSKLLTYQAAWRLSQDLPAEREAAIAKAWVGLACRRVMASAHQVHGAIGFTRDHILHYYTKKARAYESFFGDADYHLVSLVS